MRIQRADAVRAKLSELGITSADVNHAVAWAGREAAAAAVVVGGGSGSPSADSVTTLGDVCASCRYV